MRIVTLLIVAALGGCATVRQTDLDAWVGMPVEALDTHSVFLTIPMIRTRTASGIEIRNYANGRNVAGCTGLGAGSLGGGWVQSSAFTNCSSSWVGCNNIFYIKDGKVLEYAPTGRCYTDETARPQQRYMRMRTTG